MLGYRPKRGLLKSPRPISRKLSLVQDDKMLAKSIRVSQKIGNADRRYPTVVQQPKGGIALTAQLFHPALAICQMLQQRGLQIGLLECLGSNPLLCRQRGEQRRFTNPDPVPIVGLLDPVQHRQTTPPSAVTAKTARIGCSESSRLPSRSSNSLK
jgi:hypothetical protein